MIPCLDISRFVVGIGKNQYLTKKYIYKIIFLPAQKAKMPHNFQTKFGNSGHSDIAHLSKATYLINLASQKNRIKPFIPLSRPVIKQATYSKCHQNLTKEFAFMVRIMLGVPATAQSYVLNLSRPVIIQMKKLPSSENSTRVHSNQFIM